jgi:hypothetical protein
MPSNVKIYRLAGLARYRATTPVREPIMITLILALAALLTTPALARPREDAVVACLVGQAAVGLHKNVGSKMDVKAATDAAMIYAARRCKGGADIGEGGGDYVYHSIRGMAQQWFSEDAR